jgi:protein with PEP-CTERM/exosortase system signal
MLPMSGMKALTKKLLPLTLFAVAITSLFSVQLAQAYTVTLEEVGSNVVSNGSGAINLTGLSFLVSGTQGGAILQPPIGAIVTGTTDSANVTFFSGFSGPTSFGSGNGDIASSGSGDRVGIVGLFGQLSVPDGYVSGAALLSSATWNNATFASLGVTPGTYVWSWGTGLPNQNFTLQIGAAGVPDGGTTVSLLGCALLGLAALRRKLSC